jgi:hypothetical protein
VVVVLLENLFIPDKEKDVKRKKLPDLEQVNKN